MGAHLNIAIVLKSNVEGCVRVCVERLKRKAEVPSQQTERRERERGKLRYSGRERGKNDLQREIEKGKSKNWKKTREG